MKPISPTINLALKNEPLSIHDKPITKFGQMVFTGNFQFSWTERRGRCSKHIMYKCQKVKAYLENAFIHPGNTWPCMIHKVYYYLQTQRGHWNNYPTYHSHWQDLMALLIPKLNLDTFLIFHIYQSISTTISLKISLKIHYKQIGIDCRMDIYLTSWIQNSKSQNWWLLINQFNSCMPTS